MTWYDPAWPVPRETSTEHLLLVVLRPEHARRDYDAVMEDPQSLRRWSASAWPADDFTLDENTRDLVEHEREWESREAFAYSVLSTDQSRCEGCVYIRPYDSGAWHPRVAASSAAPETDEHAAIVTWWMRPSAATAGLDEELLDGLLHWLRADWRFSEVFFLVNQDRPRDLLLHREAGLHEIATAPSTDGATRWHLFRVQDDGVHQDERAGVSRETPARSS